MKRVTAKCGICGKEKICMPWDYEIRERYRGRGKVTNFETDIVHTVGGREVGREKNTTYGNIDTVRTTGAGRACICRECRILRSVLYGLFFVVTIPALCFIFIGGIGFLAVSLVTGNAEFPRGLEFVSFFTDMFPYSAFGVSLYAFTPFMRHLILKIKVARDIGVKKIWKIRSKW